MSAKLSAQKVNKDQAKEFTWSFFHKSAGGCLERVGTGAGGVVCTWHAWHNSMNPAKSLVCSQVESAGVDFRRFGAADAEGDFKLDEL